MDSKARGGHRSKLLPPKEERHTGKHRESGLPRVKTHPWTGPRGPVLGWGNLRNCGRVSVDYPEVQTPGRIRTTHNSVSFTSRSWTRPPE